MMKFPKLPSIVLAKTLRFRQILNDRVTARRVILVSGTLSALALAVLFSIREDGPAPHPDAQRNERSAVRAQMAMRPNDPWPRGAGHVVYAVPGTREREKAYFEPGGGFSPSVGSFGVSIWVLGKNRHVRSTSDDIPLHGIQQNWVRSDLGGLPAIRSKTRYYEAVWESAGRGAWKLKLTRLAKKGPPLAVVLRSVGPAGGPVRELEWNGKRLAVNDRWKISVSPAPASVTLGSEYDPAWTVAQVRSRKWSGNTWGYARIIMAGTDLEILITDSKFRQNDKTWPTRERSPLKLDLPAPFSDSVEAQIDQILMGLVDRETRPADPMHAPLEWQKEASMIVAGLAAAGQLRNARRLADRVAEHDYFGGFGPEADAPGLALWAMDEVATRRPDPGEDQRWWKHVSRKADLIMKMIDTPRPITVPVRDQPIVPKYANHRDLKLVCEPANEGLIVGKVAWQRPVLYVNAVSHRGLLSAAAFADRLGYTDHAERWRLAANRLQNAWMIAFDRQTLKENDLTYTAALWPGLVAARSKDLLFDRLQSRWLENRDSAGDIRGKPLFTSQVLAESHQWLALGQPERTWATLRWFFHHQSAPGLFTWWEGRGEENSFLQWDGIRGWVNPKGITPHYGAAAQMLLLQMESLAYVDRAGDEPVLVIGGGIPAEWIPRPLAVEGVMTPAGRVDWRWQAGKLEVTIYGPKLPVRAGPSFPTKSDMKVRFEAA